MRWVACLCLVVTCSAAGDLWQGPIISTQTSTSFVTGPQPPFGTQFYPVVGFACTPTPGPCVSRSVVASFRAASSTTNVTMLPDPTSVTNSTTVSSFGTATTNCPLGAVVQQVTCGGATCDSITLSCARPTLSDNVWRTTLNGSNVNTLPSIGSVTCPPGTLLSGVTCAAPGGCGTVTLRCAYAEVRVCSPGYHFDANFVCVGIPCAAVGTTPNGTFSSTNANTYPSDNTLSCSPGYQVSGTATRACGTDGNWVGTAPTCVGITCTSLPNIPNGGFTLTNGYTYPTVANYACDPGYVRSSPNPRSCFYDGSWTNSPVTCAGIQCSALSAPANCKLNITNNGNYPATAILSPKPGFITSGPAVVNCTTTGGWGALGSCVGLPCASLPPSPRYSVVTSNDGLYPSSASVTCNSGYTAGSPQQAFLTCQTNQSWTGSIPPCPPVTCAAPPVLTYSYQNYSFTNGQTYLSVACVVCLPGYTATGDTQCRTCDSLSTWNPFTTCYPVTCPSPISIPSATFVFSDSSLFFGTNLTYTCGDGYIANTSTFVCNATRKWDQGYYPQCTGIPCNDEVFWTPDCNCDNSTTNGGRYPATEIFQCRPGFVYASGSSFRICRTDGSWSNTNLKCVGIPCGPLTCTGQPCSDVTYTNNRTYPSIANVTCPPGYRTSIFPATSTNCTIAGKWSDNVACVGVPCNTIPNVTNGFRTISNNGLYPSTVTTSCNAGFYLDANPATITCNIFGVWSAPFASCLGVPCDTTPFRYAVQTYNTTNNYTYPDTATAVCNPGYVIANPKFNCSTSGIYCCGPFECTGRLCALLPNSSTYSMVFSPPSLPNATYFPVNVSYACAPNYFTRNSTFGNCTTSGGWTAPPPICVRFAIDEIWVNGVRTVNGSALLPNYRGNHSIWLKGDFSSFTPVVTYGPDTKRFPCTLQSFNTSWIRCLSSPSSYGRSCAVYVSFSDSAVGALQIISSASLTLTHVAPNITAGTLGFYDEPKPQIGWDRPLKAKSTLGGDKIYFEGINFSSLSSVVSIVYGLSLAELNNVCDLFFVNDTLAVCITTPGESGSHLFQLSVYDVPSNLLRDGYAYPLGPVVKSVYGCADVYHSGSDNYTETVNCSTSGGARITIEGTTFVDPLTAPAAPTYLVGSTYGLASNYTNTTVVLLLPAGTGPSTVVVSTNAGQSTARFLITYAQATVTKILGCTVLGGNPPVNCLRSGEQITLIGNNFGARGATVFLVGVGNCSNVTHDSAEPHSRLTCMLPPGFALHVPIAILQLGGFLSFVPAPLDISYKQCAPGMYQNGSSTGCSICTSGRFSSNEGQTVCGDCFFGAYAPLANSTSCILAEEGKFVNTTGATASMSCVPGTFSLTQGSLACKDCPPGTYTNVSGTQTCSSCSPGTVQPVQGQQSCDICPLGTFAGNTGLLDCVACTLGKIATIPGSTNCTSCDAGWFGFNTSLCLRCSPGTYMQLPDATACTQCDVGFIAANSSALICDPCPKGTFMAAKGNSQCVNCAPGYFGNSIGLTACLACSPGTYTNQSGLTACSSCGIGTFGEGFFLSTCSNCDPGKYSDLLQSDKCASCPAGTSQPLAGTSFCVDCLPGSFTSETERRNCTLCPAGNIANGARSIACTQCPKGTFINSTGGTVCHECQPGLFNSMDGRTECSPCPVGAFTFATRSDACISCGVGKYQNHTGSSECLLCSPGTFADVPGLTTCLLCNQGAYAQAQGSSACALCTTGTHNNETAASGCVDCDPGYYSDSAAAIMCRACPKGTFQAFSRGSICAACEVGTSSNQTINDMAATSCVACSPGYYAPVVGLFTCLPCETGKFASLYHSSSCSSCLEGSANPLTGQASCESCPPGYFAETQGVTSCRPCAEGKFTALNRTIRCPSCQPGTFSNDTGMSYCIDCVPGYIAGLASSTICEPCSIGFFSSVYRGSECVKCPKGTANELLGQIECAECTAGRYSGVAAATLCSECVPGKYAQFTRSVACGDCLPGYYVSTPAAQLCVACEAGRFNPRPGSGSCDACPAGTATQQVGAALCVDCLPGGYGATDGQSVCQNCEPGTFQKRGGSTSCDDCEPASFSVSGSSSCSMCSSGKAMPFYRGKECRVCSFFSSPAAPPIDCICDIGYFAPVRLYNDTGTLPCNVCPRGVSCKKTGVTMDNMEVEPGWWRPNNMSLDMYKCILPSHCLGGHNSQCDSNRVGLVCSLCAPGYAASGSGRTGNCELCKSKGSSAVEVVFLCLALACGLGVLYYLVLRTEQSNVKKLQKEAEWWVDDDTAMLSLQTNALGMASTSISSNDESDGGQPEVRDARDAVLRQMPALKEGSGSTDGPLPPGVRRALGDVAQAQEDRLAERRQRVKDNATLTGKVRILVSLFQIGTTIVSTMDIPWPALFKSFLGLLNFVNLDFVPWQSVGCVAHVSYFTKLYMITSIPIAAFLALIFLYMLPLYLLARRDMSDTEVYKLKREVATVKFWRLCLFTVFLMYPYVSSSIFRMYVCYNLEGVYYMKMDFEVLCYEAEWNAMIPPSTVMILVYPFGIPFFTFILLYRSRKRLFATDVRVRLGFLYESYNKYNWYFEMVVMVNKLFLVAFVGFFPDTMQMPAAMLWLLGYLNVVLLVRPYVRKSDDRLDLFAMSLLILLCMCGNVLTVERALDSSTDFVLSLLLIGLFVGIFLMFNVMMIRLLVRKARACLTKRFAEKRQLQIMTMMTRTKRGESSISNSVDPNPSL